MIPPLTEWQSLGDAERIEVASSLSVPFDFSGITTAARGDQINRIAVFSRDGVHFVLLPGATVDLGFRWKRPFELTSVEQESWDDTAEEYEIDTSFDDCLATYLSPPRRVTVRPFPLEVHGHELGKERLAEQQKAYAVTPFSHSAIQWQDLRSRKKASSFHRRTNGNTPAAPARRHCFIGATIAQLMDIQQTHQVGRNTANRMRSDFTSPKIPIVGSLSPNLIFCAVATAAARSVERVCW